MKRKLKPQTRGEFNARAIFSGSVKGEVRLRRKSRTDFLLKGPTLMLKKFSNAFVKEHNRITTGLPSLRAWETHPICGASHF